MLSERTVRRYTAYFRGWAAAFGAHDKGSDEARDLYWLFGEGQIGLVLTPAVKRFLYQRLLRSRGEDAPPVHLGRGVLRIEDTELSFGEEDRRAFDITMGLLAGGGDLHLYQTYHLFYPSGTRILTLSCHPPLPLIYREIAPLSVHLL
ncbi:MAG: hypothetical protein U9Q81_00570 [Pseudomonadota bacterium]|nr:hypothetical protein [Pseudomonadota bacterium]